MDKKEINIYSYHNGYDDAIHDIINALKYISSHGGAESYDKTTDRRLGVVTGGAWINETVRAKNEIFICPLCGKRVHYIDGKARQKHGRTATCEYSYCPWCGNKISKGVENEWL